MSSGTNNLGRAALIVAIIASTACSPDSPASITAASDPDIPAANMAGIPNPQASAALAAVAAGNTQAVDAAPSLVPPGAPLAPFVEARLYAISNVAMHDALNAIVPRFERYADTGPIVRDASIAAAVLTAAHDAIVGADPDAASSTNAWYAAEISSHTSDAGYADGVALGHRVALAILNRRAADGTAGGGVAPYTPGTSAGDYQFTFPFNTPGFDFFGTGGFADASMWGASVTPFVVASTSQFRAPRPYGAASNAAAVLTPEYTSDYNEVKAIGCALCVARTAVQTEIALFWVESSPAGWNRIARIVASQRQLDAWDTARLLALLQMGEFDSYATNLESKYYYDFWRPVSAVALAETDGNPNTSTVANWEVLSFPSPPVPDYPSAHAGAGGAAASIIESVVPGRGPSVTTTSATLPGVSRTFESVAEAAAENALSRIYVGFHFRHAVNVGIQQGREVGDYVASNALRSIKSK
jgi:hypothetical protein